ncbi:LysR family transcriptional regulator [Ralstonia solanacearum]|uniref:LysR family transcriptional regulator n=1 Tax=Ralstonia solanacearum TaxID=305 RepID=UPI0026E3ADEA|nr:LysR family transcriptional regulator [Ralstonia solanacearum]
MDSESLRIFCSVASELSITHAAARLGRAPSNVTTRIQQLEADIGTDLFVRTGKRMALSTAGERFLDYAKRLLALEDEARHVVTGGVRAVRYVSAAWRAQPPAVCHCYWRAITQNILQPAWS